MKMRKTIEFFKNALAATIQGTFLVRLRIDKYFVHIIYTVFLIWLSIVINMKVESTMVKVDKNKEMLDNMKIYHGQKTVEMAGYSRISTIESMLEEEGSEVTLPEKPAEKIEKQ